MLSLAEHLLEIQVTDLTLGNKISGQHFKAKQYFLGLFHFLRSGSMCWMCYVVISHGPVLHSVQCLYQATPVHYTALHSPAPEQLLLWFSTLWLAGLMARVKAWLLVPEFEEILGTDLDNTEEEVVLLLLLMLSWLLTYLLSGPSLSLSTETSKNF